jgi:transcriptional regulator GlxA family with amidase domain
VVRDGNLITGGGVTAGIDFALVLIAELAGEDMAQAIQLGLEYAPEPPFNAGRPETAPPHIVASVKARMATMEDQRTAEVMRAAEAMQPA